MPPLPESEFRSLLTDCSQSAFVDFVADLWRARGKEVRRDGDRLLVDGRELGPVVEHDADAATDADLVTATPADGAVGPGDLYHALLYDVPRDRAAELFESHFDRPLDAEHADEAGGQAPPTAGAPGSPSGGPGETDTQSDEDGPSPDGESGGGSETDETPDEQPEARGDDVTQSSDEVADGPEAAADGPEAAADGPEEPDDASEGSATPGEPSLPRRVAGRLPRDREEVRGLLADPRVAVVLLAVLLVVGASVWGLFLYHPTPETEEVPFAVVDRPAPVDGSYRIVAEMDYRAGDERTYYDASRTYAPGDPAVALTRLTRSGAETATMVRYSRGEVTYVRQSWTEAEPYEQRREETADSERVVRTSDGTRSIYRVHEGGAVSAGPGLAITPVWTLSTLPYERDGTTTYDGREVVRYRPTTGWTKSGDGGRGANTLRVTEASGEVLVDADTGVLLYADVNATVVKAETWAEALTGKEHEVSIRYRVETGVDRPAAPPWVEGLEEAAGSEIVA